MIPTMISGTDDFLAVIKARREALGLKHLDVDAKAGIADGHTSKIEAPDRQWGKTAFRMNFAIDLICQVLGIAIVVMDRDEAMQLCKRATERRIQRRSRDGSRPANHTRLMCVTKRSAPPR